MARFFFYGTLLDAAVQRIVFGRGIAAETMRAAVLENFRPARARGVRYPILVSRLGARTEGMLVAGLSDWDVARLVYYEDAGYTMQEVPVRVAPGRTTNAWVFIPSRRMVALPTDWSLADWQRRHKPQDLPAIVEMMRAFPGPGRLSAFRRWRARRGTLVDA
ncbi:MAG: gamma-glutamylcyclotransferase family protein [Alphaproteobacteria bacterium]